MCPDRLFFSLRKDERIIYVQWNDRISYVTAHILHGKKAKKQINIIFLKWNEKYFVISAIEHKIITDRNFFFLFHFFFGT